MTDSTDIPLELQRLGAPARGRPGRRRSELERLVDRTVLGPTHPEPGTCWLFTGTTKPYGRIAKAQDSYTHRLGWKLLRGPIPDGMELHHRCGVYACWNPDHLQVVTHAGNLAYRRKARLRATVRPRQAGDLKRRVDGIALPARFWKKVNKNGPVPPLRPEQGTPEKATGYVRCEINRVRDYVHRFVYRFPTAKRSTISVTTPTLPARAMRPARTVGGGRVCRACNRAAQQRFRERVAAGLPPYEWLIMFIMLTEALIPCAPPLNGRLVLIQGG
jgi:HNH endonuclease